MHSLLWCLFPKRKPRQTERPCVLSGNFPFQPVSFLVSLCSAFMFPIGFFVLRFLWSLSIFETGKLLPLVGLVFHLPRECLPSLGFLPHRGHSTLCLCTLLRLLLLDTGHGEPCGGSDSGKPRGGTSPLGHLGLLLWAFQLGSGVSNRLFVVLPQLFLPAHCRAAQIMDVKAQGFLEAFILPNNRDWLCSLPITQALSNALLS